MENVKLCKKVMTSRTWLLITSSDDFKLCGTIMSNTSTMPIGLIMYRASVIRAIIPVNGNAAGVSNTCIKTLLLCWRRPEPLRVVWMCLRIHDPARRTADNLCWYWYIVVWTILSYTHTHLVICKQENPAVARKPRDAAAVLFSLKFADNIHYKFKSSRASKARLQSSKHTGTKQNLTQNGDSRSFKVTCFGVSGKYCIIMLALFVKVPTI